MFIYFINISFVEKYIPWYPCGIKIKLNMFFLMTCAFIQSRNRQKQFTNKFKFKYLNKNYLDGCLR